MSTMDSLLLRELRGNLLHLLPVLHDLLRALLREADRLRSRRGLRRHGGGGRTARAAGNGPPPPTARAPPSAPHDAHTNPRKSTPRFPKPRSRSHWKPSARFGSNTRLRLAVKSRFRSVENPSVRIGSKLRRFATAPPTPTP